ncbi:hypothetical protein PSEUDO8AS_90115 [Pseudomonas sp. 8AS]|nr:hypothetical protein PSEUDO8AS_90115 [Pseudomonas sp. 8AS]
MPGLPVQPPAECHSAGQLAARRPSVGRLTQVIKQPRQGTRLHFLYPMEACNECLNSPGHDPER